MRKRSIQEILSQYWGSWVTRFQAGYTVPAGTPEQYLFNLQGEVKNWQVFGGQWSEPDEEIRDRIFSAYRAYAIWYGQILQLPLPQNSIPEYEEWYRSTH